jgi:agmatinase
MLIVKVPGINGLGKTNGCEKAPQKILSELQEIYTNEQGKEIKLNKKDIKEIPVNHEDIDETNGNILEQSKKFFSEGMQAIFLGGDHSISYPLLKSFSSTFKNAGVIVFDAHADCMHNFNPPTHEDWLRVAVEEGFAAKNVVLVGLRNIHPIEQEFFNVHKFSLFPYKQMFNNLEEECDAIMEISKKFDALYLSIDIDAVDSAFAPGTGYPEPAGLSSRELIYMLQRIKLLKNLKAIDLVEINPLKDINSATSRLAAKIISELI